MNLQFLMPIIKSSYKPSFLFKNAHFNTVFRTFFTSNTVDYKRHRLELKDGDFMDLDFLFSYADTILIALHGLEGSTNSTYIKAVSEYFDSNNIDVCAVNFRGCSGEDNRLFESYYSGRTEDLEAVIKFVNSEFNYKNIILLGYSLGGNMTLKYLGEQGENLPKNIKCSFGISVPCDLTDSSNQLSNTNNKVYLKRFLIDLKKKTLEKNKKFPDSFLSEEKIKAVKNFKQYDDLYTAPAHGFKDAEDYWEKNSCKPFLENITIPTLIINALDDTFLGDLCYPYEISQSHEHVFLETPKHGGHVGFNSKLIGKSGYWLEKRIYEFALKHLN